jgi:hypothetical protein
MQDRSADDRSQPGDRAAAGPADRLSLTVSVLLIGGLLLASVALYQNARIDKPKPRKQSPAPVATPLPADSAAALAIQLPPPPASHTPSSNAVKKSTVPPKRDSLKPARRIVEKPRIEPLKPPPVARPRPRFKPVPAIKASVKPSTKSAKTMVDGAQNKKTGGALLRLLEHGQGPTIEIAWPRRADARRALYRQLSQCYGVRAAVLAGGATLYADGGTAGQAWPIDRDRFSGFIRSPQGEAIAEEARVFARIADRHGLTDWRPVRVFPRHVDAALLGGLGALLGPRYKSARQIRAAYRWDRARLILGDFTVDGRPLGGAVTLALPRGHARNPGCD